MKRSAAVGAVGMGALPLTTNVISFGEKGVAWLPGPALPPAGAPTPPVRAA
jgi:hypothetical protein